MLHALPHSMALLLWVLVKTLGKKGVHECFSLFRLKLVHFHTTTNNNKNHVTATADKRHLPRACWWSECRSRVSWPCWEWNLIELPFPLHSVTCRISQCY